MPVYCAYCGKSFTRKEHLERHIPSHTNVKPHRCGGCQLSFTRRDLLQRHHATYHESRSHLDPPPPGHPPLQGRTPIACQNCANAKTGCDKRVPCSRCADKNLPCAARFARRSSKAAVRAQHAASASASALVGSGAPVVAGTGSVGSVLPLGMGGLGLSFLDMEGDEKGSPKVGAVDEFMMAGFGDGAGYGDMLGWPAEYPLDLEPMYSATCPPLPMLPRDVSLPCTFDMDDLPSPGLTTPQTAAPSVPSTTVTVPSSSSNASMHTRATSIMSLSSLRSPFRPPLPSLSPTTLLSSPLGEAIREFDSVVLAESAWPLARCTAPAFSAGCPRTAAIHLSCLEQRGKDDAAWTNLERYLEAHAQWDASDVAAVMPLSQAARDRLLAITQNYLQKALDIHQGSTVGMQTRLELGAAPIVVLPPNPIIGYFLLCHVRSLHSYYPLVAAGCVDANHFVFAGPSSPLLVLLMLAQGAASIPMAQARFLAAGLTEMCRLSLFDLVEKNVELAADPVVLRGALLWTMLGAWSGDKWLMDIAMGQRGMYMSMLRHASLLEHGRTPTAEDVAVAATSGASHIPLAADWLTWQRIEAQNRLVYNWVLVDQELSLFHDCPSLLSLSDMNCPLPGPEPLWAATTADQWATAVRGLCSSGSPGPLRTLRSLFADFANGLLSPSTRPLTSIHLRLLLHPIQETICHVRGLADALPNNTPGLFDSAISLLAKWYDLCVTLYTATPVDPTVQVALTLHHLLHLLCTADIPLIERLARKEISSDTPGLMRNRGASLFHAGQVLRLVRCMSLDRRPAWWPAAVYRATMVLWAAGVQSAGSSAPISAESVAIKLGTPGSVSGGSSSGTPSGGSVGVRTPGSEDGSISVPRNSPGISATVVIDAVIPGEGTNSAVGIIDAGGAILGSGVPILVGCEKAAGEILGYGGNVIGEGRGTRFGDGIRRKLGVVREIWAA